LKERELEAAAYLHLSNLCL